MNAYTNFIKLFATERAAIDHHNYFYLRMELAECKLQLCRNLLSFDELKSNFQQKFALLTAHILDCSETLQQKLSLVLSLEDQLFVKTIHSKIEECDYNKTELDELIGDLNGVFVQHRIGADAVEHKITFLSA